MISCVIASFVASAEEQEWGLSDTKNTFLMRGFALGKGLTNNV